MTILVLCDVGDHDPANFSKKAKVDIPVASAASSSTNNSFDNYGPSSTYQFESLLLMLSSLTQLEEDMKHALTTTTTLRHIPYQRVTSFAPSSRFFLQPKRFSFGSVILTHANKRGQLVA